MPTYTIRAPNGKTYSIDGPPGATEAQVRAEIMRRDPSAGQPPKRRPFAAGVESAKTGLTKGLPYALEKQFGEVTPEEEAAYMAALQASARKREQLLPGGPASLEQLMAGDASLGALIGENLAYGAPQMAATLAGGVVGAAAGSGAAAPTVFGVPVGATAGGILGATAVGAPMFVGTNVDRATAGGQEALTRQEAGRSLLAAPAQAAVEGVADRFIPGVGRLLGAPTREVAGGIISRVARGGAKGAAAETITEPLQTVGERYAAVEPLTDREAFSEYGQAAGTAAILGGTIGAVGGPFEGGPRARPAIEDPQQRAESGAPAPGTQTDPDVPLSPFEQAVLEVQARVNIPREDAEAMVRMAMPEPEQVEDVAGTDTGGLGAGVSSTDGGPVGGQPAGQPADTGLGDVGAAGAVDGAPVQRAELVESPLTPPSMTDEEMLNAFEARGQEQQETPVAEITPPVSAPAAEITTPSPEPSPQLPEVPAAVAAPLPLDEPIAVPTPAPIEQTASPKLTALQTAQETLAGAPLAITKQKIVKPEGYTQHMLELNDGTTVELGWDRDSNQWHVYDDLGTAPEYYESGVGFNKKEALANVLDRVQRNRARTLEAATPTAIPIPAAGAPAPKPAGKQDQIRAHPAVESVDDGGPGQFFVNLKPGFQYSEQRSFGAKNATEALKLLKSVGQEPAPTPAPAPEPTIKEIPDTSYAPAWQALQAFEAAGAPAEAVEQLKGQIVGYDKLKSEGKTPAMTPDMFARFITKRAGQLKGATPSGPEPLAAATEDSETPSFARSAVGQERTPLPMENVTAAVKNLSRGWTNSPQFIVTPTFADLPTFIKDAAGNDPAGIRGATFRKGNDVYIVADQHTTPSEVKATVFHEALGHSGLQKYFGDTLSAKLQDIYNSNSAIKTLTDTWLESNPDAYSTARNRTARAIEEVLAERSEGGTPQLPVIRRALATLKGFLRGFASRFGMKVGYSDADVQAILARAHGNIRKGAATRAPETQKAPVSGYPDSPAFARTPPAQKAAKKSQEKLTLAAKKVANAAASAGALGYDNSAPAKELIDAFSGNIKARDAEAFVDEAATQPLSGWPVPVLNAIVPQIPSADIVRWAKTEGLELDPAYRLLTEMTGYHGRLQRASTRLGEDFNRWIGKNGSDVMSATMHYARLAGLSFSTVGDRATALQTDPELVKLRGALANAAPEKQSAAKAQVTLREKDIRKGYDLWDALGQKKGGHEMYRRVHQHYADMYDLSRALIKQRIESMGLEPKDEAKLWQTVRLEMEQARDKGDYFPLMRNGKYYAYYKTSPVGRIFETFDTAGDRDKAVARYQKDFGIKPDGQGSNVNEVRNELTSESAMLRAMLDAVRKQSGGSPNIENLLDDTYQMFLQFLPERSLRKQFIHTKNGGVAGFSSDVARNFANMAGRYASQLPKLKYAHKVQAALDAADDTLKGRDSDLREKLGIFSGEVRRRAEQEFNPEEPNAALSVLNRATATFLLSGGATALAQTIAIPQRVLPHLTRYYGFGPTNRMAIKYMQFWKMVGVNFGDFGRQGFGPSIGDSAYIKNNPVLKEIFDAGQDQFGLFESNASHYLDTAPSPTTPTGGLRGLARDITRAPVSTVVDATKRAADVTSRALMWTFSVSERLVNQQTFMMAAELELAKSGDKEKAKEAGVRAITDAIGRYQRYERPQIMRGTLGPTLTMFKMYPVHTTSFFIRNVAAAAKEMSGGDPKAARAAALEMGYVLAMTGVFAGAVGMPLYSTITMVTDLVIKAMDDEEEEAERLADDPFYGASADLRFRYRALPNLFGDNSVELGGRKIPLSDIVRDGLVPTLTDAGIGSRASLDGIWFRAGQGDSTASVILNTIAANLPGASFVTNFGRGYDLISQGEVEKGLEAMLPAGARNLLRATRFSEEGITTNRGDPILEPDEFTDANFLAQVLGLPVQRIAGRMDAGRKVKARSVQLGKERQALLRRFNKLGRDPQVTDEQLDKLGADMRQFNATVSGVPKLLIDADALNRSWSSFEGRPVADGYVLDPRLGPYELEVLRDASSPE